MTAYITRRLLEGVITLIALSFVVFGSVHLAGDPARFLLPISAEHDETVYEEQRKRLGLDKPFIVQYWNFLKNALLLDFGNSFTERRPVQEILAERICNRASRIGGHNLGNRYRRSPGNHLGRKTRYVA